MALLSALFPATVYRGHFDDVDTSAYIPDLCKNIRFSIYEYLMSEQSLSEDHRRSSARMKLPDWCGIPGYDESRQALVRYVEEFKKLEQVCLGAFHRTDPKQSGGYTPVSRESSFNWSCDSPTLCDTVQGSKRSSVYSSDEPTPELPTTPAYPNTRPGQEILGAETDLGAFVGDPSYGCTPSLCSQQPLGMAWDQHPLARHLDMTPDDQTALGLLIPRAIQRQGS